MKHFIFTLAFTIAVICNMQAQAWGDFTLYSLQNSTTAQLMNNAQQVVKTWTFAAADKTGYSSYLLPGGSVIRAVSRTGNSFSGGPICGKVQKHDWAGNLTWDFVYSTTAYCTHHDIHPMPNGNVLLIAYEARTAAEATAKGATNGIVMWPDKIVEVQPTGLTTGTVVWEWKIWDHTCQNTDAAKPGYVTSIVDNPQLLNINYKTTKDWIHMNGLDYNPILDQITFSSHNLNEWYVIDHSTTTAEAASHTGGRAGKGGDFLYRWGNTPAYAAGGTAVLNVTHDAHWIPEGTPNAGRLVGFNNKGVSASASAVDQAMPPRVGYNYTRTAGAAYAPATYDARHAVAGYSSNMGSSQQLPNGNMLVCVATAGKVYEINSAGTTLWSKTFSGGACPQSFKYDSCYVFNQPPAVPIITRTCTGLTLPTSATYQWYMNGDIIAGATAQTYTPTQNGAFVGRITDANGCVFRYSPTLDYIMPLLPLEGSTIATPSEIGGIGGTVTALTTSGTSPFMFLWDNAMTGNPIVNLPAGTYCVTITDAIGCTATACTTVQEVVATNTADSGISFVLSPNPTSDIINIKTNLTDYTATLSDIMGKVLLSQKDAKTIDLAAFANGVYFINIKTATGATATQRILKR